MCDAAEKKEMGVRERDDLLRFVGEIRGQCHSRSSLFHSILAPLRRCKWQRRLTTIRRELLISLMASSFLLLDFPPPHAASGNEENAPAYVCWTNKQIAAFIYLFIYQAAVRIKCNSALWLVCCPYSFACYRTCANSTRKKVTQVQHARLLSTIEGKTSATCSRSILILKV